MSVWKQTVDGVILHIVLTPKSSRDAIGDIVDTVSGRALRVKVRAIPDKGKANQAAIKLLAKWIRVPKTSVELVSGSRSRYKTIKYLGDSEKIIKLLEAQF